MEMNSREPAERTGGEGSEPTQELSARTRAVCDFSSPLGTPPGAPYKWEPRGQEVDKETNNTVH